MSYNCGTAEGFPIPIFVPSWYHVIFAPLFISGIVYCQPRFVSREALPRPPIPSGPSSSAGPIWPALGELSTGASNRGVLRAWLICISMALLLVDGLPSRRTPEFYWVRQKKNSAILKFYLQSREKSCIITLILTWEYYRMWKYDRFYMIWAIINTYNNFAIIWEDARKQPN